MRKKLLELFLRSGKVCTDTRRIETGALFFSLKGDNFNGNQFAHLALEAGCSWAIVDEEDYVSHPRCLLVKDALKALQNLASDYRNTFDIPILAITGSNGKTTTKELTHAVLSKKFKVHSTEGNFNNHIGVPLTLLSMLEDTEIAIIEMGANHLKEIAELATIAQPSHALITNIGKAHLEGFGSLEGVKKGKGELFDYIRKHEGTIFVNKSVPHLASLAEGIKSITYEAEEGPLAVAITSLNPTLQFSSTLASRPTQTHLTGAYNIHNFVSAIAVGRHFGVEDEDIVSALEAYQPTNQRSQIKETEHNTLILDAYNANPSSMVLALENLSKADRNNKFFVLGDMLELGSDAPDEHQKIVELAKELKLNGILVGNEFSVVQPCPYKQFPDVLSAKNHLTDYPVENQIILIKGSRSIKLEKVVDVL